jgi:hypothetical protein
MQIGHVVPSGVGSPKKAARHVGEFIALCRHHPPVSEHTER